MELNMAEEKQVLPGHETQTMEMNCPSCGRFVGAKSKCPYCSAKVTKRMSLMATRWAAILLATVGMFCLWMMARGKDVPVVKIGDIQPTMNFGQIRVDGQVDTDARITRNGGMSFNVSDGTGSLIVFASQKQAAELRRLDKVPLAGDKIIMMGGLSLSDKDSSMRLQSVSAIQLVRAPTPAMALGDIDDSLVGNSVLVQGQIIDFNPPQAGSKRPYSLRIKDESGTGTITFWQPEYDQIKDKEMLVADTYLRLRVSVSEYKGKTQLTLSNGDHLEVLDPEDVPASVAPKSAAQKAAQRKAVEKKSTPAPAVEKPAAQSRDFSRGRAATNYHPMRAIKKDMQGQKVRVKGRVATVTEAGENSNKPTEVLLYGEDGGSIQIKYWDNVGRVIQPKPAPGYLYDIEGEVDVFQGKTSLKVGSGYAVKFITDVPPSEATVDVSAAEPVAGITLERKGETVVLVGTLGADQALKSGVKFPLTDEAGSTVDVVLWAGRIPADLREKLEEGTRVAVRGDISEYNGTVNVAAASGYSVMVLD